MSVDLIMEDVITSVQTLEVHTTAAVRVAITYRLMENLVDVLVPVS